MRDERCERPGAMRAAALACALCAAVWPLAATPSARTPPAAQTDIPPAATCDPGSIDFGEQVIGRWGRAHRVVVTNTGGAPLHVNNVNLGGDDAGKYSIENDTCTGADVVPFRSCVIDVAFLPSGKDDFDAELTLTSNAPESPQTIKLTGEGINSAMEPPGGAGR